MDVNTRSRADLKAFFVKNSIPTQSNFADLIDGMLNQKDDGFVKAKNLPLSIEAADPGVADSEKKAVTIYQSFADPNPAWTLSLNPRTTPNDPKTAKLGFSISDGEGTNRLFIDRNSGHVGIGTTTPNGKLEVATGGAGAWNKFVVNTTNLWGDGNAQYVTIGEGGAAGIMLYNPHVVWYDPEKRASIRMGRSRGIATGHWWDIGVRVDDSFSIIDGQNGMFGLSINSGGTVRVGVLQLGDKWRLSGLGDHDANDEWLRLKNIANNAYYGGFAASKLWSSTGQLSGSDRRMKTDINLLEHSLDKLLALRGVSFKWQEGYGQNQEAFRFGLIAQEVEKVFPEVVENGPNGLKSINYSALIAPLVESVKCLQDQIVGLQAQIRTMQA